MRRPTSTRRHAPSSSDWSGGFAPYVPVAERRPQAAEAARLAQKRGQAFDPVVIEGRGIARTHWGKAFSDHLENHCDHHNRLERGRRYVRNGSVVHLAVGLGRVDAKVMGSAMYTVNIDVVTLSPARWRRIEEYARGRVASLLDLLAGRLPHELMHAIANPDEGLFPRTKEMTFACSCPDYAAMCKHVAAVLYGVAARADARPELLFTLRGVDARNLVSAVSAADIVQGATLVNELAGDEDLSTLFGIELESDAPPTTVRSPARKPRPPAPPLDAKRGVTDVAKATRAKVATKKNVAKPAAKKAPSKSAPTIGAKQTARTPTTNAGPTAGPDPATPRRATSSSATRPTKARSTSRRYA